MEPARAEASVVSRDVETDLRKGRGFSQSELKEAGISQVLVKLMKIPVDSRRRSSYPENVAILKGLQKPEIKKKAKKPKKEKVKAPKKKKVAAPASPEPTVEKPAKKAAKKAAKKPSKSEKAGIESLPGITEELSKKLTELGIADLKKLAKENAKELSKLSGTEEKTAQEWIDFAKKNK